MTQQHKIVLYHLDTIKMTITASQNVCQPTFLSLCVFIRHKPYKCNEKTSSC